MRMRLLGVALAMILVALGCGSDEESGPAEAESCGALSELAAVRIRTVVDDLGASSLEDLGAESPDDPLAALTRPFDGFAERSDELGCVAEEMVRITCENLDGLTAGGPAAEQFLRSYFERCD